jgi:mannose-1-phosphate guanylyltransferase
VYEQLPQIDTSNILTEPGRRGTASCFLLALAEIKKRGFEDEPVFFLWADHLIRNVEGFAMTILKAGAIAAEEKKLVFIGVEPAYPSTGLGYMERDGDVENWQGAYYLEKFQEKPDKKTAEKYYRSGKHFWNTGYLVGSLSVFEREMKDKSKRLWKDYQKLLTSKDPEKTYLGFTPEPIDTALSEKISDGIMVPASFDWADVGSFKDLHEISTQDDNGNHAKGGRVELDSTSNSYVRNETKQPVAVIGLDNVIVVATDNGIVVANKNFTQHVGDVAKRLQA